ncbi:MAG: 2-succinyl-5-enolpyruvyl-6-hydroxy-3-cyclohexene-1-carboxylic-acid synthase [Cyanobacteria bacterium J06639_14]
MTISTVNINSLWGSLLVEELVRNGVNYFIVSPGSRSTPLTVAIARHPQAQSIVCFDERAAAFHALGYTRATGQPAVLVCTSGTAAANYYPAVIEAAVDTLPLIIVSADRPPELHHTGANQTIQQTQLYGRYAQWEFELPCPDTQIAPQMVLTTVDQAVYRARRFPGGPVHLNCLLREPLAPTPQTFERDYLAPLQTWRTHSTPYTDYGHSTAIPSAADIAVLAATLNQSQRGLLVVGRLANQREQQAVLELARALNWPVFADVQSGLRLQADPLPTTILYFDQLWPTITEQDWTIETVVQIGRRMVSKRFLQWLEVYPPQHHLVIADDPLRHDPVHTVSLRLETRISDLVPTLLPQLESRPVAPWVTALIEASQKIHQVVDRVLAQPTISEPAIARAVSRQLPADHGLYLANSMPIRDMDMYGAPEGGVTAIGGDRGTSGIEGAIAAAAGFAVGRQTPVTLLVGDLSLLHDLNSLALLKTVSQPVIVVVINNDGGGIFSFLPVAQFEDVFEPYFGAAHGFAFEAASQMFGLDYYQPQTSAEFIQVYQTALQKQRSAVIEVVTDRQANLALHQALHQEIKAVLHPTPVSALA